MNFLSFSADMKRKIVTRRYERTAIRSGVTTGTYSAAVRIRRAGTVKTTAIRTIPHKICTKAFFDGTNPTSSRVRTKDARTPQRQSTGVMKSSFIIVL